jgi:hypothetical protein
VSTAAIPDHVELRVWAKLQTIRAELGDLKKTYAGSVSLRCLSLNDQCDLLEDILGLPRSFPRATQEDR